MENFHRQESDLERYIHLETLHDRNETLFYRVLLTHLRELTPIVYTPTVGKACSHFGHIYRRARGMYFSAAEVPCFEQMVRNWPEEEVDIVVVTDGSRILGLGDLGANGMGIPIGKLSLYVAGAGIYPYRTLPVMLDLGTNNAALREDPLYLGERIPRLTGDAYYAAVDAFVRAVQGRWPRALIQFEDFSGDHAFPLLARYRDDILCFNDDIQGTGAVALAGILSALRITGQALVDQRVVFLGAGSAARGIADAIVAGMMQAGGLSLAQARERIWMLDTKGLVTRERLGSLPEHKRPFARDEPPLASLVEVIRHARPTVLIGVCGQPGGFTEEVLRELHPPVRAAHRLPAFKPHRQGRVHRRAGLRVDRGGGDLRQREPLPAGHPRGAPIRAGAVQQHVHLPRRRHGGPELPGAAGDGRHVLRRRAHPGRAGGRGQPGGGASVPGYHPDPGDLHPHRRGRVRGGLRPGAGRHRAPGRPGDLHPQADVPAALCAV